MNAPCPANHFGEPQSSGWSNPTGQAPKSLMNYDHWLQRWAPVLKGVGNTALDVGCGSGYDTEVLTSWGICVVATDISQAAIDGSRQRNPDVKHVQADAKTLEPFSPETFDLVVACLSLHYFDRLHSHSAFQAVNRVLRDGGIFALRANAWDDYEFGAPAVFRPWELTSYGGKQKQFFTEEMLHELLADRFEILGLEKMTTCRYVKPKSIIEVISRKIAKPT